VKPAGGEDVASSAEKTISSHTDDTAATFDPRHRSHTEQNSQPFRISEILMLSASLLVNIITQRV
jgi:hypothetical protein